MIDVPVVSVVQVPRACVVKKTVENPQFQTVQKSAEDPQTQTIQGTRTSESSGNASFHQAIQAAPRVQKIVEMPKVQSSDGEVDMPVVAQRQVPMVPNVQKTVEVPQIQYVDKIVDAPVVARSEDVSVGTQTVSRKRKLSMETESADGTADEEHGLVQEGECESKVDETRERHAAGENPICSRWRLTWRPVAHTSRPRQRRSESWIGPKICERSAEWLSSWCVGKGSST